MKRLEHLLVTVLTQVNLFLRWWQAELIGLLPLSWREWIERATSRPIFRVDDGGVGRLISRGKSDASKVDVLFDRDALFVKRIELPAGAKRQLQEVVGLQLDRYIPWAPEDVYFACRVVGQSSSHIVVDIAILPKAMLSTLMNELAGKNLVPMRIRALAGEGDDVSLFEFGDAVPHRIDRGRTIDLGFMAATALLAILMIIAVDARRGRELIEIENLTQAARAEAQVTAEYRTSLRILEEQRSFLLGERTRHSSLELLEGLSRELPDTAWLREMHVAGVELRLQGQAENAAGLLPLLDDLTFLENVQFNSAVMQDSSGSGERFDLTATLVEGGFDD